MCKKSFFLLFLAFGCSVSLARAEEIKGKLIEFGWDMPDVPFLVKHIDRLEQLPFDGVVIDLGRRNTWSGAKKRKSGLAWSFWQKASIDSDLRKRVDEDIKLLGTVKPGALKYSFIQVNAHPGGVDWFDDNAMKNVIYNWKLVARAVSKLGFGGIFFDIEYYHGSKIGVWNYSMMPMSKKYTYQQYKEKVLQRANEIIKAIKSECPKTVILFSFGNADLWRVDPEGQKLHRYGLLPIFIDGCLKAGENDIKIVDGYEHAYGFRREGNFKSARDVVLGVSAPYRRFPKIYKKKMCIGYGLFIDVYNRSKWHTNPKDFDKNFYTPAELAYVVHQGLRYGDYVWIYTQQINWWKGANCPQEYIDALWKSKTENPQKPPYRNLTKIKRRPVELTYTTARLYDAQDDYTIMTPVWKDYRPVLSLPGIWQFKIDPKRIGEQEKWFAPKAGNSGWKSIVVPDWWNCKGSKWHDYRGVGWYRVDFNVSDWAKGRTLILYFGGVDEEAKVWLNGQYVGEHNLGSTGWNLPFKFDVTKYIRFGRKNRLVVRVDGGSSYGGIWRSVYLITPVKE